jgi:hypothetical protein
MTGSNDKDRSDNAQEGDGKSNSSPKNLVSKDMLNALNNRRDEQILFARFKNAAVNALEQMSRQEDNDGDMKKFQMGREESRIIRNLNGVGMIEGLAAGIFTFVVLRKGPLYVGRWFRRRLLSPYQQSSSPSRTPPNSSGYSFSDPNATNTNPFLNASNPSQEFPRSGSFLIRSIWFMFDATLSLMMAASTSVAYTDTEKIRRQVIDMPLIQGTSLISEALCDPIVRELAKTRKADDRTFERLNNLNEKGSPTPASTYLDNIIHFAENCERRRYMERKIRLEHGLSAANQVEIPITGVPRFGPRLVATENDNIEMVIYEDGTVETFSDAQFEHNISWESDIDRSDKKL